ncbi:MAG: DUF4333 domain-containing protein [Actinomycetota bacterium]|nr:DUF4333 domain-containing protein [Actinomycetota bacterium]
MSDLDASENAGAAPGPSARPAPASMHAAAGCPYPGPAAADDSACPFPGAAATGRTSACGYAGRGKRGYFIPGLIALAVLLAGGAFASAGGLSHASPTRLDGAHVGTLIAQNYQNNHQLESPPPVECPNNEPVAAGHLFVCHLLRTKGGPLRVEVTETGGGQVTYQVTGGP